MSFLNGHLLVAAPELIDPNFDRTVVLIVRHDENGALGLVLNRPTRTRITEVWRQISTTDCARDGLLYHGGPCESDLMFLHDRRDLDQFDVLPGTLFFSCAHDHAERLVTEADGRVRAFVGHSGWAPGQLESELRSGSWLTIEATAADAFRAEEQLWDDVRRRIGRARVGREVPASLIPDDPSLN